MMTGRLFAAGNDQFGDERVLESVRAHHEGTMADLSAALFDE